MSVLGSVSVEEGEGAALFDELIMEASEVQTFLGAERTHLLTSFLIFLSMISPS
jgi:hypothetical protein